jgi:hypothetical protein
MRFDSDRFARPIPRPAAQCGPAARVLRWGAAGLLLVALAASLGGTVHGQAAVPPAESQPPATPAASPPPQAPGQAAAPDAATLTFRRAIGGSSLMLGVSRTYPSITIIDLNDSSTDPVIEQYRGDTQPGYTISWHVGFADQAVSSDEIAGSLYSAWSVRLAAELDTFTGKQSLLLRPGGGLTRGQVTGEIAWGGMELLALLAWENSVLPMAWSASAYIGLAAVQYRGQLEFTSAGAPYKGTAASNGPGVALVIPFELRWHLGPVVVRHIWLDSQFAFPDPSARLEYRGRSLANAAFQYTLGITTLGYAITY